MKNFEKQKSKETLNVNYGSLLSAIFFLGVLIMNEVAAQTIKVASYFSDGIVLQRDKPVKIWGTGAPGQRVEVEINSTKTQTLVGPDGSWVAILDPMPAGGPYELRVSNVVFKDVLVGDVWFCGGQSNMYYTLDMLQFFENEIATADFPEIRMIRVKNVKSDKEETDLQVDFAWTKVQPNKIGDFSAVAYFFAKTLYQKYKVPIGLISNSWGGSPIEVWMSPEALSNFPEIHRAYNEKNNLFEERRKKQEAREKLLAGWKEKALKSDAGTLTKGKEWYKPVANTASWPEMALPEGFDQAGLKDFDGIVWFVKKIELTEVPKQDVELCLGRIDDDDEVWVNGNFVGKTSGHEENRRYTIPSKILKKGTNTLVVRVHDWGGNGGILGKEIYLQIGAQKVILQGLWKYAIGYDLTKLEGYYPPDYAVIRPWKPMELYNAMIAPMKHATFKGLIWYQGESNASRAYQYRALFPAFIQDWRSKFDNGDFPVFYVQLANFLKPDSVPRTDPFPELREAQLMTLTVPNTAMVSAIDLGEISDIHPKNKYDVGLRLAYAAMHVAYNEKTIVPMGPIPSKFEFVDNKVLISFKYAETGLVARGQEKIMEFVLAGEDKIFYPADAKIILGNKVEVTCEKVQKPVAVRYAWANNPAKANLYNKAGLPATPFRSDDWPGVTFGKIAIE